MSIALATGRARSDIEVISRAGLPLAEFMEESANALLTVVPFIAGCFSSTDPATSMISSTHKLGDLYGRNDADVDWARIEYGGEPDATHYDAIASAGHVAVGIHATTGGQVERIERMADLVLPRFGYVDEARVVFADRAGVWGTMSVLRGSDDAVFDARELAFLASVAPALTRGIRTGLLSQLARRQTVHPSGPAVIIFDSSDRIVQSSPGAQERLAQLSAPGADPLTYIQALVSGARRFASGASPAMPRTRTRTADGVWLVLHAAPLGGLGDRAGDVVVTIEEARPQEVIDIVAAAFALTIREREVVGAVLRGADTKEIAASMHVSPYTVQDHLKSIFEKAGVTSRRELVSRVYFDQYMPRAGSDLAIDGWYATV
ncbi:helix-turn-helix transcriptional regulator [Microbacterium sp. CJ77]|uniref:helix-turn-helix transcriptional regulator n=1 Tax=Microbacterium sp. CJ77 TaxID=2079201 RepID=UPI000CD92E9A|nr:helix-turn-helix transcriptional regulator [Microbacterium sp. CJ77]